jgi:hypothetical protein
MLLLYKKEKILFYFLFNKGQKIYNKKYIFEHNSCLVTPFSIVEKFLNNNEFTFFAL